MPYRIRKLWVNFTWPLFVFARPMPEPWTERMAKIYVGKAMRLKTREELLESIRPNFWNYLREDCGDLAAGWPGPDPHLSQADVLSQ